MTCPSKIDSFSGDYRFLSNFHPVKIKYDGHTFPSAENAYQYAKLDSTKLTREHITYLMKCWPSEAKKFANAPAAPRKENWDAEKVTIMRRILILKFSNLTLEKLLLDTGDAELIEGNTWGDTFWGVCEGKGKNILGKLLMEIRTQLYWDKNL